MISSYAKKETTLPFGLTISTNGNGSGSGSPAMNPGAIGLFSFTSFEGSGTSGSQITSGSGHVEIFVIPGIKLNDSNLPIDFNYNLTNCVPNSVCLAINNKIKSQLINPENGITFCLNSGTTNNQSALFSLGGHSSPTSATYTMYSQSGCT